MQLRSRLMSGSRDPSRPSEAPLPSLALDGTRPHSPPIEPSALAPNAASLGPQAASARWFAQLQIGQKIGLGYAVAVGLAIAGTVVGIAIGDRHYRQAHEREVAVSEQLQLIHDLETRVLESRTHGQQLLSLVDEPSLFRAEYARFLNDAARVRQQWAAVASNWTLAEDDAHTPEAQEAFALVQAYESTLENYFQGLSDAVAAIDRQDLNQAENQEIARQELVAFISGPFTQDVDFLTDALSDLADNTRLAYEAAEEQADAANVLRMQAIALGMAVSLALSALLAAAIGRAIVRPIRRVTEVAQTTTRESDFTLRAPVTTKDEVGALTASVNQLVASVESLLQERESTVAHLIQSEKMSSLGQLVAGVAHEINNPVTFIYSNIAHVREYTDDLMGLLTRHCRHCPSLPPGMRAELEDIDLDFIEADLPKLLASMETGADRIQAIVRSLREFSRLDESEVKTADIRDCLDSTLTVLHHRLSGKHGRPDLQVIRDYGETPPIDCYPGQLNQAFVNLLGNAIDVLEERDARRSIAECARQPSQIRVQTVPLPEGGVSVRIADNGPGIPESIRDRIFDPFFTTKPVGKGTGLGLALTYQAIVDLHGGQLTCQSTEAGTTFLLEIPRQQTPRSGVNSLSFEA